MRPVLAAVLAAIGCTTGAGDGEDGTCSLTDPCADGSVCDFTAEAGPTCISASGDLDGDGLTNDKDFCQHAPGGQFDEDVDGIGDDCDRCPIAPPRAIADSDTDMVDAPCDPAPNDDGDEILLFDGFAAPGLNPRWKPTTASVWSVPGGEAIAKLDTITDQEFLRTTVVGKDSVAIEASFRVDKLEGTMTQHLVGVYADDPRPAGAAQGQCYTTKADIDQIERVVIETNMGAMNQITTDAFDSASLYRAGLYVRGTTAGCSILANNNPLATVQTNITADQLSSIALTAKAASVRFQYVIVVGH